MEKEYVKVAFSPYEWSVVLDALRGQAKVVSKMRQIEMEVLADWIEGKIS